MFSFKYSSSISIKQCPYRSHLRGTDTHSREATLLKLFCLPPEKGSSLKEKKFFSFREDPFLRRGLTYRKANRKLLMLSPLKKKMAENLPSVFSSLNLPTVVTINIRPSFFLIVLIIKFQLVQLMFPQQNIGGLLSYHDTDKNIDIGAPISFV